MKSNVVRTDSGYVPTDASAGADGISAFMLEDADPGFSSGVPKHKPGIKGPLTREPYFYDCEIRRTG